MKLKSFEQTEDTIRSCIDPIGIKSQVYQKLNLTVYVPIETVNRWLTVDTVASLGVPVTDDQYEIAVYLQQLTVDALLGKEPTIMLWDNGKTFDMLARADFSGMPTFIKIRVNREELTALPFNVLPFSSMYVDALRLCAVKLMDEEELTSLVKN